VRLWSTDIPSISPGATFAQQLIDLAFDGLDFDFRIH